MHVSVWSPPHTFVLRMVRVTHQPASSRVSISVWNLSVFHWVAMVGLWSWHKVNLISYRLRNPGV